MTNKNHKFETRIVHAGRNPDEYFGVVNTPIARTSTILYDNLDAYFAPDTKYRYGRVNNPVAQHFEEAVSTLEGGYHAISTGSGFSAVTTSILSFVQSGDHILIVDSAYAPTRIFAQQELIKLGIEVEFYEPTLDAGIEELIRENTSVIYMESPGSYSFTTQDVAAITKIAKSHGITTILDNTYSAGLLFNPIKHGVNIAVQSAAKYISGHSDLNLGFAVADTEENYKRLKTTAVNLGVCAGPEDMFLAMRGLRTLQMRMEQANENVKPIIEWFQGQTFVQKIYNPALPDNPGHENWKKYFGGKTNGLFSVLFDPKYSWKDIARFTDALTLFPVGSSWGGYESLIQPSEMKKCREFWPHKGALLRFQVGNEHPDDLIRDLGNSVNHL